MRSPFAFLLLTSLVGCGADAAPVDSSPTVVVDRTESLGALLSSEKFDLIAGGAHEGPAIAVADVLANPDAYAGKMLRVRGVVQSVGADGVSLAIGSAERPLRVRFSAERTAVPSDAAGREFTCEGELELSEEGVSFRATGGALAK